MAKGVSGKRHAQAVFQIASDSGTLEEWHADLKRIDEVFSNADVARLLDSPKLSHATKREVVANLLSGISPVALNLAQLLVNKKRLDITSSLLAEYERLMNSRLGRETAILITAIPLHEQEKQKIAKVLAMLMGKELVIDTENDPEILGGLIARVGDTLIDGSVRTTLLHLKESLR